MTKHLIVGGGLAGLYAGYLLQQRNFEFKILEASSRLGGRICCEPHSLGQEKLYLDLGPTWFWPHQTEMINLLDTLQLDYFEQYCQGEALFEDDTNSPIKRFMPSYLESFRMVGGMQGLIDRLASELPEETVHLNSAVSTMESVDGIWQLSLDQRGDPAYSAERLIIAAPPRVIVDKLKMPDDSLLALKDQLASVPTWMAAQAKFVASYASPFWREQGLSGQAFSRQGPMVEIHDASADRDDGYALFGFIGIPADSRRQISSEALKRACLDQLAKIFGDMALNVERTYLIDWANNGFIAASRDMNERPHHPDIDLGSFRQSMIDHGLYFASSEVATLDPGYLRGALVAASDAVDAVIAR